VEGIVDDAGGIDRWLDDLGLGAYKSLFAQNHITLEALPTLTGDDLKELVPSIGHRRTLAAAIAKQGPVVLQDRRPDAERRQLTVMFCDLVGSTALSERLDPEDLKEVITSYQDACAGAIARYEGVVARLLGDGVLAYFGFPQAHEDDAERAVRAGLDVIERVKEVASVDGEPLLVRIGIATGGVVVGEGLRRGRLRVEALEGEGEYGGAHLGAFGACWGRPQADHDRRC